jgi:hypothetical protein
MQRDHPRPRFYHDFVHEYRNFPWWCLLANYDWGRDYYAIGVQTFAVCWSSQDERPVFHIVLNNNVRSVLDPSGRRPRLRIGDEGISYD